MEKNRSFSLRFLQYKNDRKRLKDIHPIILNVLWDGTESNDAITFTIMRAFNITLKLIALGSFESPPKKWKQIFVMLCRVGNEITVRTYFSTSNH